MNVSFNLPAAKYDGNSWYGCINLYFVGFKWSGWSYNWRRIILTGLNKLFTLRPSAPVLFHLLNWILNIAGFLCAEYQMSILSNYWYNHADVRSAFLLAVNKHVFNCVWEFSITWPTAQQKQQLCLEMDFFFSLSFEDYMIMHYSVSNKCWRPEWAFRKQLSLHNPNPMIY